MIVTSTPYRISFFGGGTDYPAWYRNHGGAVLATSINRYCYISSRFYPPFFEHKHRIVWSRIELVDKTSDIVHPTIREAIGFLDLPGGLEIHHHGDLPARSGIGSSSAFTVGVLQSLHALKGELASKQKLAEEAIHLEQNVMHESVGVQDQITCAHGGFNLIEIDRNGSYNLRPVPISTQRQHDLEMRLLLIYSGISRSASEVAAEQIAHIPQNTATLKRMQAMVYDGAEVLSGDHDLRDFGALLHETWQLKRSISPNVSTPLVDSIYERGRRAGAIGGKLMGAGGGGFVLMFVEPEKRAAVLEALIDFLVVPFEIERSGTYIVHYQPDQYSLLARNKRDFVR